MTANPPSSSPPTAVIDGLNALLEAEQDSVFRFMDEGSPYLSRAAASIRNPLNEMVRTGQRHAMELATAIDRLGGLPLPRNIQPEEQYLAFLTLKFLLPKLLESKELTVKRYENTIAALGGASSNILDMLKSQLVEHREHAAILRGAVK